MGAPWLVHDLSSPFLVFKSDLLQNQGRFVSDGVEYDTHHSLSRHIDIVLDRGWSIDRGSCVEQCVDGEVVARFACLTIAWNNLVRFAHLSLPEVVMLIVRNCSRYRANAHLSMKSHEWGTQKYSGYHE